MDYILAHAVQFLVFVAVLAAAVAALTAKLVMRSVMRERAASLFGEAHANGLMESLLKKLVALEFGDANGFSADHKPTLLGLAAIVRAVRHSRAQLCWVRVHLGKRQLDAVGEDLKLTQQLMTQQLITQQLTAQYSATTQPAFVFVNGCATLFFQRIDTQRKLVGIAATLPSSAVSR
jgi:hypothetical protein